MRFAFRDAQRLQALNEVSRSLAAILEPQAVFATIARLASELLDAPVVRLWVHDPRTGMLGIVASDGIDAERAVESTAFEQLAPGQGLIGRVFETRQPESALPYLERALQAPPRPGRNIADTGRREEARALIDKIKAR